MKETKTYYKLVQAYPNSPKLGTIIEVTDFNNMSSHRLLKNLDSDGYYVNLLDADLNSKFYEKSIQMTEDGYPLFNGDDVFYLNIYLMCGKYVYIRYSSKHHNIILFKLESNMEKFRMNKFEPIPKPNLIQNITKFDVGTIVTKVVKREYEYLDLSTFYTNAIKQFDTSYMSDFYKIEGFGNNFVYLKQVSGYYKNELSKVDLTEYGEGWQQGVVPNGMSLEQILGNKIDTSNVGHICEITKKQTNREYFSEIPIGTKFIIIDEHCHMPAYDVTGYFINYPPQINKDGEYHYTGYIEKDSWKIVGKIADNIEILNK